MAPAWCKVSLTGSSHGDFSILSLVSSKLSRLFAHVRETLWRTLKTGRIPDSNIHYLGILHCDERAAETLSGMIENAKLPVVRANVVAGSGYNIRTLDGKTFIKKSRSERMHHNERSFYEYMGSPPAADKPDEADSLGRYGALRSFIPGYLGSITTIEGQFLLLEDLTAGMQSPSVIDIKLGKISGDGQSKGVAFEINGARISGRNGEILMFDYRHQWRHLSCEEAHARFNEVFSIVPPAVLEDAIEFLRRLRAVFSDKRNLSVRDSSILIAWEQSAIDGGAENTVIRLIDFQKANHGRAGSAERCLAGIDQVTNWIRALRPAPGEPC